MNVEINQQQLDDVKNRLAHINNGAAIAMARALNKTAAKYKTQASKAIRKQVALKASETKTKLRIVKATKAKLSASLQAEKRGLLFYHFVTNYGNAQKGRPKTKIRVRVKTGGSTIVMASAFYILTKNSSILTPAVNTGGRKIKVLFGPSVSQVFKSVKDDMAPMSREDLAKNLQHEMEWLLIQHPPPLGDGTDGETEPE